MIHLPLSCHGSPHLEARVGLDEDALSGVVRLELDLGEHELVGAIPEPDDVPHEDRAAFAHDDETGPLRDEIDRLQAELDRELRYSAELRRRLEGVKAERNLWRELLPDEARALAAMLVHYAGEAVR